MAKATMGRSKFKIQRRLGVELPGLGKAGALERKPYGPGVHGMKRKKLSDFTIRLMEKQKIMFNYGLREGQLRNLVSKSKRIKSDLAWVDVLVIKHQPISSISIGIFFILNPLLLWCTHRDSNPE